MGIYDYLDRLNERIKALNAEARGKIQEPRNKR
jgi:hypothetical protein